MDPLGLAGLLYDVQSGILTVDPQQDDVQPYSVSATSGTGKCRNETSCDDRPFEGPIPRGDYTIDVNDLSDPNWFGDLLRRTRGDWGDWRVPIKPVSGTNAYGRDGFFLHLGAILGSAGCIDIGGGRFGTPRTDKLKSELLADPDMIVPLRVK